MAKLVLRKIKGNKANKIRWDALRMLDWEKDYPVIEKIFSATNPLFFSKRTPEQVVEEAREKVTRDRLAEEYMMAHR